MSSQINADVRSTAPDTGTVRTLRRTGGIAAHVVAGTYVIGFVGMLAYLVPQGFTDAVTDPAASLEFLADQPVAMYAWYLVLYLVGGAALAVLVLALHERMHLTRPAAARLATAFGLIWSGLLLASGMIALIGQRAAVELAVTDRATAVASWHAVSTVQDALGGGIELVGALWLLIIGHAGLRTRSLPPGPSVLGLALGIAGLCTLIPAIQDATAALFGVGLIIWFTWTAHTLLSRAD